MIPGILVYLTRRVMLRIDMTGNGMYREYNYLLVGSIGGKQNQLAWLHKYNIEAVHRTYNRTWSAAYPVELYTGIKLT